MLCQRAKVDVPESVDRALHLFKVAGKSVELTARGLLSLEDDAVDGWIRDLSLRSHSAPHPSSTALGTVGLQAGIEEFTTLVLSEVAVAIGPEVETLIDQLRSRFDETAAPIVTAVQQYGIRLTTTADEIVERRDSAVAEALVNARDAWRAVQPFLSLRQQLSSCSTSRPRLPRQRVTATCTARGRSTFGVLRRRRRVEPERSAVCEREAARGTRPVRSRRGWAQAQQSRRGQGEADPTTQPQVAGRSPDTAAAPVEQGLVTAGGKYPTS